MLKNIINIDIKKVVQLRPDELADIKVYGDLASRVMEIGRRQDSKEALILVNFLNNFLETNREFERNQPKLYKQYQGLLIWLKFIASHLLLDDDLYQLIRNHLLTGLKLEVDVRAGIRRLFQYSWDPFIRGEKRDLILKAFSGNNQSLGDYKFTLGSEDRVVPATVSNFIVDYNRVSKSDTERGGLEEAHYMDNSSNIRQLTPAERGLALKVLQVYDLVRFPPLEEMAREMIFSPITFPASTPTVLPKRGLPRTPLASPAEKVAVKIQKPPPTLDPVEILKQKYQAYRSQRQSVLRIEDEVLVKTKGEVEEVNKELAIASRQNEKNRVIACLKVLARQGALINSLAANPGWFEAVATYIKKKYSGQYKPEEVEHAVSNLKLDSSTPAVLSELLQYLLQEKLKLTENDSALVGVEIGQLLGDEYQSLAYGNQESASFEWTKNKIINKRLVSEIE